MPKTFAGRPWTEQFLVHNPSGGTVTADILDIAELPLVSSVSSSGETLTANADFSGGEPIFLTLQRANDTLVGFDVTWKSPLSYLDLDDPLYLYVGDESGIDRLGADEPEMQINFD